LKSLVTGGSGFLGGHLVEALVKRGEQVRVLVRPSSNTDHLEPLGVELYPGDLGEIHSLKTAAQGVDIVYHCAALAADWGSWEEFEQANVTGTRNLLQAALDRRVDKFIHISTTDVYGFPDIPVDETAPFRFRGWPYGDTKIKAEEAVWEYHRQKGLPTSVVRPLNIYGPRSTTFVLEIAELLKKGSMVHIGKGLKSAGLVYVTNVVDLILLAADNVSATGKAYHASDGSSITWPQYVNRLADIIGTPHPRISLPYRPAYMIGWLMEKIYGILAVKNRPLLTRMAVELGGTDQGFSIAKAQNDLNYSPAVDFEEGMRQVKDWLLQIGYISQSETECRNEENIS
jgi:nucleoside-diphosphate-sugar epimerase